MLLIQLKFEEEMIKKIEQWIIEKNNWEDSLS